MREEYKALLIGNVPLRHRIIKAMFAMVKPYMKKSLGDKNRQDIVECGNVLASPVDHRFKPDILARADLMIDDIKERILEDGKDFFLPRGDDGSDDIDWDEIKRSGST